MSGHNTVLLVIACGVTSEFEDLGSKVFEDGGEIYCAHHVRHRNIVVKDMFDIPGAPAPTRCA